MYIEKSLRFFSSAHENWGKNKSCVYNFGQCNSLCTFSSNYTGYTISKSKRQLKVNFVFVFFTGVL